MIGQYEKEIYRLIVNHRKIALCAYSLIEYGAAEIIDIITGHLSRWSKRKVNGSKENVSDEEILLRASRTRCFQSCLKT